MKTVTEKRFFEWHEDDVAVTLRNKGGSYGGGARCLSFALLIWSRMITRKQVMNDVWTMDEKWGLTMYIHHNLANTRAASQPDGTHVHQQISPLSYFRFRNWK